MSPAAVQAVLSCVDKFALVVPGPLAYDLKSGVYGKVPIPTTDLTGFNKAPEPDATDQVEVIFVGLKGSEQASFIKRQVDFSTNPPSADAVFNELIQKYGEPQVRNELNLIWVYDRAGRPMTKQNPVFQSCIGLDVIQWSLSPGCGLTIRAIVNADFNTHAATRLNLGIVNQQAALDAINAEDAEIHKANLPVGEAPKL